MVEVIPSTPTEAEGLSASASESVLMEGMIAKRLPAILAFNNWYIDLTSQAVHVHTLDIRLPHYLLTVSCAHATMLSFRVGSGTLPPKQFVLLYSGFDMDRVNISISKVHSKNL